MKDTDLIKIAEDTLLPLNLSSMGATSGQVAAALLTDKGHVYKGVCIDTPCSLGFCAEHNAIGQMLVQGEHRILKTVAVHYEKGVVPPCGRCRELMYQLHDDNKTTEVILKNGTKRLEELLPDHWQNN